MSATYPILRLSEMTHEQEGDLFVLMTFKEELTTRDGKPYFKVGFRDSNREVVFPVWDNSPWAADCRERWVPGLFYKVRAMYRQTNYGPQLDIRKIRETTAADSGDGFDPMMCQPQSRFKPEAMFEELLGIARKEICAAPLARLVETLLVENRQKLLVYPAARRHHHAFVSGLLEHVLSVTRTAIYLADKYAGKYADLEPPLDRGLVVAGAILHDVGKLVELDQQAAETVYTAAGALVGHVLLGRDLVRDAARQIPLEGDLLLRLEHIIISHQRLAEWGAPKPPMTPEALLVHYADDVDAKFDMFYHVLRDDKTDGPLTSDKNLLRHRVYRGTV